ncbi:MAG: prolyl oligopeptidase family serine peptidase [Jatrophihabitans sp.]|uniref:prolyl oligopeptidase family serine peptidase n=1 Tax=Jatrophihabitans sp. TaxID=1932789 RepID=UPI003F81F72B
MRSAAGPSGPGRAAGRPQARGLGRSGSYRAADAGAHWPVPAEDVVCAVSFAAARARALGITPTRLVLLGHSAGAQLAAVAGLTPDRLRGNCPYPAAAADAVIGLAGPYDVLRIPDAARPLLPDDPTRAPASWRAADPMDLAGLRPSVPFLLAHGTTDSTVPPEFTDRFATALRTGGHPVAVVHVPGVDHAGLYTADVAVPIVLPWLAAPTR